MFFGALSCLLCLPPFMNNEFPFSACSLHPDLCHYMAIGQHCVSTPCALKWIKFIIIFAYLTNLYRKVPKISSLMHTLFCTLNAICHFSYLIHFKMFCAVHHTKADWILYKLQKNHLFLFSSFWDICAKSHEHTRFLLHCSVVYLLGHIVKHISGFNIIHFLRLIIM